LPPVVGRQRRVLRVDASRQARIRGAQLLELLEILGASLQVAPGQQARTERVRLALDRLRRASIVPEAGLAGQRFQRRELALFGV
jgi:hypothetical protein